MVFSKLLVANRGEIAVRVIRTAREMGIPTVAVYSADDALAPHVRLADEAVALPGEGAPPYLDIAGMVAVARQTGCDALHPGYGFLSENAAFAEACHEAGIVFVGPPVESLRMMGDKVRARAAAASAGLPILRGEPVAGIEEAAAFMAGLAPGATMLLKAVAGGGGRGLRVIQAPAEIEKAFPRAESEAKASFGDGRLYAEQFIARARHIEVQVLGDAHGAVIHFGERDCSLQRRHQKILEIAPAPAFPPGLRDRITAAAVTLAKSVGYQNAGTVEFLVDASGPLHDGTPFFFIEANARLQVEHTVTEEVMGIDLVRAQIEIASGRPLAEMGFAQGAAPRGFAIQARVNMETMQPDGSVRPAGGMLAVFDPPGGPGVRLDTFGYAGFQPSNRFDSLLAKVIGYAPSNDITVAAKRTARALSEFRIEGTKTNAAFLRSLLEHPDFLAGDIYTRYIDDHAAEVLAGIAEQAASTPPTHDAKSGLAGARIDTKDPLAVLSYGQSEGRGVTRAAATEETPADGSLVVASPLQGTIVSIAVAVGDTVRAGQTVLIMESMKMEHEIKAEASGIVRRVTVAKGDTIVDGVTLLVLEETQVEGGDIVQEEVVDLDYIRPDLALVLDRRAMTRDEKRPEAVARRRKTGQQTTRENLEQLVDPGTFVEYGPLVLAAQRARRSEEELIVKSPADGMVTGVGSVNGDLFGDPAARCAIMAYDYTVFAGTQGAQNHRKTDRLIDVAEHGRMPMILFAEGGGGRPGDTDRVGESGQRTFSRFAQLSALVPMVGITSGRCFAGNASLLGCCDVIIATEGSNIGMGGPAMIEGGGLGIYAPEDIGPMDVQVPSGVVDILVRDEQEAVTAAKKYLSYFQGRISTWVEPDQRLMRRIIPENRLRVYDIRKVIDTLSDEGWVMELRPKFGLGCITSLIRVEGRTVGIIANNPAHLGGAIDSDAADKASRFMQVCDAFDIPLLYLCDTPGIMVGPEIEKTALVRHSSRMFLIGANLSVPFFTVILRKAYGLGAIAMAGGSYKVPAFAVSWPTGEFGGMGLEGSVKLGFREVLAAIEDPEERRQKYESMVARAYENGKALNNASGFGIDDAIDPAETRFWLANLLASIRPPAPREGKKRSAIDAW
ncbi:MAG: carbamoyl-phosphate synthase large subunit [Dehalococcoidia bacterium]|nr:carbamoyl-phosphate synthase large subunit [Dehalococcoidia bacterium]